MNKKVSSKISEPSNKEGSNRTSNQKKSKRTLDFVKENTEKLQNFATKVDNDYISTIFQPQPEENLYKCLVCKNVNVQYKNLKRHVTESITHSNKVKEDSLEKHKKLLEKISSAKKQSKFSKAERDEQKKNYLEYLGCCFKAKLSFRQISLISKYIKDMYNENKLNFFNMFSFKEGEISKAANTWGDYLIEELKKDLTQSKYSLCVDNSTVGTKSICALEVRYLKKINENEKIRTKIQNRIIGIKYLEESSTGKTIYQIVQDKLLSLSDEIKNNLIGTVHDQGSNLTGPHIGLIKHLKNDLQQEFFDLNDPCHGIHLAVEKALESLPSEPMKFINKIHSYFRSPQRISFLSKIQQGEDLTQLSLCHYVDTRWLSLGLSLNRLIQIWPSLKLYVDKAKPPRLKKKDKEYLNEKLIDPIFYLKVLFLSQVLNKTNSVNVIFQTKTLEVHQLKIQIHSFIREIAELFLSEMIIPDDISKFKTVEWKEKSSFLNETDFIENLKVELSPKLSEILESSEEDRKEFIKFCQNFLETLLDWLIEYLPIDDVIVNALTFVSLPVNTQQLRKNILCFNQYFQLHSLELEESLKLEINDLVKLNIDWMRQIAEDSALRLWDLIETTYNKMDSQNKTVTKRFPLLSKIFNTAHAIATSSATIEQTFSLMKILKNDLRNRLSEKTLQSLLLFCQEYNDKAKIFVADRLIEIFDGCPNINQNEEQKNDSDKAQKDLVRTASNVTEISESTTKKLKLNSESQNVEQEPIFLNFSKGEENEENNDRESENSLLSEMNKIFENNDNEAEDQLHETDQTVEDSDDNLFV